MELLFNGKRETRQNNWQHGADCVVCNWRIYEYSDAYETRFVNNHNEALGDWKPIHRQCVLCD